MDSLPVTQLEYGSFRHSTLTAFRMCQRMFRLAELVDSDAVGKNQARRRGDRRDWRNVPHRVRREFQ